MCGCCRMNCNLLRGLRFGYFWSIIRYCYVQKCWHYIFEDTIMDFRNTWS